MAVKRKLADTFQKVRIELGKVKEYIDAGDQWVAVDPSCVSQSSEPAFAIFKGKTFIAQGTFGIEYKYGMPLWLRLQMIRDVVQKELAPQCLFLVIEHTPDVPIRTKKGAASTGATYMNPKAIASLKQACGAIKCAFDVGTPVIDMPPGVWSSVMRQLGKVTDKEDDTDARFIGEAAIELINQMERRCVHGYEETSEETTVKKKSKGKRKTTRENIP
jgi:hypothetical protein